MCKFGVLLTVPLHLCRLTRSMHTDGPVARMPVSLTSAQGQHSTSLYVKPTIAYAWITRRRLHTHAGALHAWPGVVAHPLHHRPCELRM